MNVDDVMRLLPHRYPFLFIDAVHEFEPRVRIVAVKNVTADELFFTSMNRTPLVMPGLLILEAMAQAGGVLLMAGEGDPGAKVVYFASIDAVRWRSSVRPGDQLRMVVVVTQARGRLRKVHAKALVEEQLVCEADMAAVVMDR